jgi:hypothetical protein
MNRALTAAPSLTVFVFDAAYCARCDELGEQLGLPRGADEKYIRYGLRLVAEMRARQLPEPRVAGLLCQPEAATFAAAA